MIATTDAELKRIRDFAKSEEDPHLVLEVITPEELRELRRLLQGERRKSNEVNVDAARILRRYGLGEDNAAQRFLAKNIERRCRPYVPMSAGSGAHMVTAARVTEDSIIYPGPYAHYQYVGEVMAGRAPKHYTGQDLTYHDAPMRGKQWDKRMMADHGREVERDLEIYLKERGK